MTLQRHHAPFHPANAYWVRKAYRMGRKSGLRSSGDIGDIVPARTRWLKRHAGNPSLIDRLPDWEDGFRDGQMERER